MKYVLWTLGIEAALFMIWIVWEAKKQIKEEESEGRYWPPDFFDR